MHEEKPSSLRDHCPFSKNSPNLKLKLKQPFAKGGDLAVRARPVWWLWQRWVHFCKGGIVGPGVQGCYGRDT